MIWERLGRRINHKYQAVNSVVFIEANLDPSDVIALLKNANESKTVFIASGSKPLSHDRRKAKCKEMIAVCLLSCSSWHWTELHVDRNR